MNDPQDQEGLSELGEKEQKHLLEDFVVGNPDLARLETELAQFNLFEAIGVVRSEVRHSDFLAFLLDPSQNHGLGEFFLKSFLQHTLLSARGGDLALNPIEVDTWDLGDTEVRREWQNIDILLINQRLGFICLIENKIDAGEHSGQLKRYRKIIEHNFGGFKILPILLSKEGDDPSDEHYIGIDYSLICQLVEGTLATRKSTLGADVATAIGHYAEMLRRHIVSDSEIIDLAQTIYRKHKQALDIILEHRPDTQTDICSYLQELIESTPGFVLIVEGEGKTYILFVPESWEACPQLMQGQDKHGWLLVFQFINRSERLDLTLSLGPGELAVRTEIWDLLEPIRIANNPGKRGVTLNARYNQIWKRQFLSKKDLEDASLEDLTPKLEKQWRRFVDGDSPPITKVIAGLSS